MTKLYYANQYVSKTLSGAVSSTSVTTGITLDGVTGLDTSSPSIAALSWSDPLDEDVVEWLTYDSINGSNEFVGAVRGAEGGTARTHVNGATVAFPISEAHINNLVAVTRYVDMIIQVEEGTTNLSTGNGKAYVTIPAKLNGVNLSSVHARVITAPTDAAISIQIHNVTDAVDMLSTALTIDATETGSDTAATPAVVDTSNDDVATNDLIRIDIDQVGSTVTGAGLIVRLGFDHNG